MKPLTVVTGIVLGTCFSIMLSLAAVWVIFFLLGDEYPRLGAEYGALLGGLAVFTLLTAISAASFYTMATGHAWRYLGQGAMWCSLLATGVYFWP